MKKIIVLFCMVVGGFNAYAVDLYENSLKTSTSSASVISKSTLPNNDMTDEIIAEAKQLMPDENWAEIDALDKEAKITRVRSLLAVKAYEAIREEWLNDFKAEVEKRNDKIWEIKTDDSVHYLRETAKQYYGDGDEHHDIQEHCEKVCYVQRNFYEKEAVAYFDGCEDSGELCENVTPIPEDWEELWWQEDFVDVDESVIRSLYYLKESAKDNTHVEYTAWLSDDFAVDAELSVQAISLQVGKMTVNFSKERGYKNAERRDVINGKRLDALKNNGVYTKKWSPVAAGGYYQSKNFDFMGQLLKTKN